MIQTTEVSRGNAKGNDLLQHNNDSSLSTDQSKKRKSDTVGPKHIRLMQMFEPLASFNMLFVL